MISRLTENLDFHSQALMLRAERQKVIAGNIANADTPGFKARDFDFASALKAATGDTANSGNGIAQSVMASTTGGGATGGAGGLRTAPPLRYAQPAQTSLDDNSVDMDRERAAFANNALKYESTLRFINGSIRTTLDAMKSPNQS
ncbi:MAG: flagellar basal body rod protein FlgB [Rubrivivax sp.]